MLRDSEQRQDPFKGLVSGEPAEDLGMTPTLGPSSLARPPRAGGRKTPLRPSEKRRKERMLTTTFSDADIPRRVRALARKWDMFTTAGHPNHSAVLEYLLLPRLEQAEQGEIGAPGEQG
jgi:hypothetical protein